MPGPWWTRLPHFRLDHHPSVEAVLPHLEGRLAPFGARPHRGKVYREAALDPAALYPRWPDWLALVQRWGGTGFSPVGAGR